MPEIPKKLPVQFRRLKLSDNGVDVEHRTAQFSISSETPVKKFWGTEILSHDKGSIVDDRLRAKAVPFLRNHDWDKGLGKVMDHSVIDKRGIASIKFARHQDATDAMNDMNDGISTEVSVGYVIHEMEKVKDGEDVEPEWIVRKWEPIEVSLVTVPADFTVGVGRDAEKMYEVRTFGCEETNVEVHESDPVIIPNTETREIIMPDAPVVTLPNTSNPSNDQHNLQVINEGLDRARSEARAIEQSRCRELTALGERYDARQQALEFILANKSVDEFMRWVLDTKFKNGTALPGTRVIDTTYGQTPKQMQRYNICKALLESSGMDEKGNQKADRMLTGFEGEMSREVAIQSGRTPNGFFLPEFAFDLLKRQYATRVSGLTPGVSPPDLAAVPYAQTPVAAPEGGDLIMQYLEPTLIPFLRNKMVVGRAGATMMGGLVSNLALPRQITAASATWNAETADPARSGQTFDQVILTPQRLSTVCAFSKLLLAQSNLDVQTIVRDDLLKVVAIAQDYAALAGPGSNNSPTGILSLTADTSYPSAYSKASPSVTFSSSGYATWTNVVAFEGNIEANNIDLDDNTCAYVTSPAVKQMWKTLAKVDPRATNQFYPLFLWEEVAIGPDGRAGRVNGYPAFATNQLNSTNQVIFGRFNDLVIGTWGGLDLVTDPYTLASAFQIRVVVNLLTTVAFRYGPAFCYSTNAGNLHS